MRKLAVVVALVACAGCGSEEARLREALRHGTGLVRLPAGVVELSSELVIPKGARGLRLVGAPSGTLLRASKQFRGRAILRVEPGAFIMLSGFSIDGNRAALEKPAGLPPSDVPFSRFTTSSGILAEGVTGLSISRVHLTNVAGFAILVSGSRDVVIQNIQVDDSGSRNGRGRNNASGGILLEEGAAGFRVLNSRLRNVRGNGVWTHSLYTSPRNREGLIAGNRFENIGRDAIQVGHATGIRVEKNTGARIGYPFAEVDVEGGGIPVALDTSGNVDQSVYASNRFDEVDGKCIDLDGFHHGDVVDNSCTNRGAAGDYPYGHYGIVFNNSNPDMQSDEVTVARNLIDGAKLGGIFVIGAGNRIVGNRLLHLNLAHNSDSGLLQSGIYLGAGAARPAPARDNVVQDNQISGYQMSRRCIAAAPGVSLARNKVGANRCSDQ